MTCPCSAFPKPKVQNWHATRGIPTCDASRAAKAAKDALRHARGGIPVWIPGSPIRLPEVDPL